VFILHDVQQPYEVHQVRLLCECVCVSVGVLCGCCVHMHGVHVVNVVHVCVVC